jgi:hypothetical protein
MSGWCVCFQQRTLLRIVVMRSRLTHAKFCFSTQIVFCFQHSRDESLISTHDSESKATVIHNFEFIILNFELL